MLATATANKVLRPVSCVRPKRVAHNPDVSGCFDCRTLGWRGYHQVLLHRLISSHLPVLPHSSSTQPFQLGACPWDNKLKHRRFVDGKGTVSPDKSASARFTSWCSRMSFELRFSQMR